MYSMWNEGAAGNAKIYCFNGVIVCASLCCLRCFFHYFDGNIPLGS